MISLLPIQIIIDIVFFIVIILLLRQLNSRILKQPASVDPAAVSELKKIISESQEYVNHFLTAVDENEMAMNKLIRLLDSKEKKLLILIEQAEALINQGHANKTESEPASSSQKYEEVLEMIKQGLSREEVAKRSGLTEGEINLVIELFHSSSERV